MAWLLAMAASAAGCEGVPDMVFEDQSEAEASGVDQPMASELRRGRRHHAGVAFETLGDLPGGEVGSTVADISADGEVVVGSAEGCDGTEAVRWTRKRGLTALGSAPSAATGVSPNGKLTVGTATVAGQTARSGASWREDGAIEFLRGGPLASPSWPMFFIPEPNVALDDGRIFGACVQNGAYGDRLGCRYDGPEQVSLVGNMSVVFVADAAGNLGGTRFGPRHAPIGSLPALNDRVLDYPPRTPCLIPHDCRAELRDFSAGAAVAVGVASLPPESDDPAGPEEPLRATGIRYSADAGVTRLPDLAGGSEETGAYAVSADGAILGGFGTDESGRQAVLWLDGEPRLLRDVLCARRGRIPDGYTPREVRAMSPDARVIAGNGTNAAGQPEGFVVVMPEARGEPRAY